MQNASVFRRLFGLPKRGVVLVRVTDDEAADRLTLHVRLRVNAAERCGVCGQRGRSFDNGGGELSWRALDLGTTRAFIAAVVPRVRCPEHGVVRVAVPWAAHGARHTHAFDDVVAWLAIKTSKSAVEEYMRISWRTVGKIMDRVFQRLNQGVDRLDGLRRVGIDDVAYKKGHKYLMVVVDHDTGRLVWAKEGHDGATVRAFFDELGVERSAQITHISADSASFIRGAVKARCPQAILCADPFHIVAWGGEALDEVRRHHWNTSRGGRPPTEATRHRRNYPRYANSIKRTRWALWKNPENLTDPQRHQLEWIAATHPRLWRAYCLKEGLRYVFKLRGREAKDALDKWLRWASRSRLTPFVELAQRLRRNRATIDACLDEGMSNAITESTNTKIRVLTRVAYGFHSPAALIAIAMLSLSTTRPRLPGRLPTTR